MPLLIHGAIWLIGIALIGLGVMILTKKKLKAKLGKYDRVLGIIIICLGFLVMAYGFRYIQVELFELMSHR